MDYELEDSICPVCGDPIEPGTVTCARCGTLVTEAATATDDTDGDLHTATSQIFGETFAARSQQHEPQESAFADMYFGPDNEEFLAAFQPLDVVAIPGQDAVAAAYSPASQTQTSFDTVVDANPAGADATGSSGDSAPQRPKAAADDDPTQLAADTRRPTKKLPGNGKTPGRLRAVVISVIAIATVAAAGAAAVMLAPQLEPEPDPVAYAVKYVDENSGAELYTREGVSAPGTQVTPETKKFSGYKLSANNPSDLTLTVAENADNTVSVLYTKLVSYTVKYIDKDTKKSIKTAKKVKNKLEGSSVTAKAPSISGYTKPSKTSRKLVLGASSSENVITFKYTKKKPKATSTSSTSSGYSYSYTPSYSYSGSSGGSSSSSGSSKSSGSSSKSSKSTGEFSDVML